MSLILEALRKLERDRHTQERGFLVLAPPAWTPAGERAWPRAAAIAGMAALAGGAVAALVLWPGRTPPSSASAIGAPADSTATPLQAADPSLRTPPPTADAPFVPATAAGPRVAWPKERTPAARPVAAPSARETVAAQAEDTSGTTAPAEAEEHAAAPDEEPAAAEPAPATAAGSPATLRLEAIAERDGQPVAVVNGRMVRVGDPIGTATVVRIGAGEIELETEGRRQILRF